MRKQEIYNTVRDHLLNQNKQSIIDGVCQYRGPKHTMCAVGCLIPDELYDPRMEGASLLHPKDGHVDTTNINLIWPALRQAGITARHAQLLKRLQDVHDADLPADWPRKLANVAAQFDLKP